MPLRLVRYVYAQFLKTFGVVLAAITGIFIVIDFADRAHLFTGPGAGKDVAKLYAFKALTVGYQLTPAALLLAAGACISAFRRRGELTAMGALTVAPRWLYVGVALGVATVVATSIALDEVPVAHDSGAQTVLGIAGQQVDEITAVRFHLWGDFGTWYGRKQWFRGKDRVYFLRRAEGGGFSDVSIFTLTSDFRLAGRIDAARMEPFEGRWRLLRGTERDFPSEGATVVQDFAERSYDFPERPEAFELRQGRPEQMTLGQLDEEVARREHLGLPSTGYRLASHSKLAYPVLGLPASLLAVALALRRNRKGHLTTALLEGVGIVAVLWLGNVLFRAAANAGHLTPLVAAWAPDALIGLVAIAVAAWLD